MAHDGPRGTGPGFGFLRIVLPFCWFGVFEAQGLREPRRDRI